MQSDCCSPPPLVTRRAMLVGMAASTGSLQSCSRNKDEVVMRPEGIPLSRFDKKSTAEQVVAGLDLKGRTVLITGATSGLGLETMRVLASQGARVLATGRTLEKARTACASVGPFLVPPPDRTSRFHLAASAPSPRCSAARPQTSRASASVSSSPACAARLVARRRSASAPGPSPRPRVVKSAAAKKTPRRKPGDRK